MTTAQLAKQIRHLCVRDRNSSEAKDVWDEIAQIKSELHRLYHADLEGTRMHPVYYLKLYQLNLKHRVIPLHQFGQKWNF